MKKLLAILSIIFLLSPLFSFAASIFTDDFNSYADGDLNGQGSWTASTEYDIQGTTTFEGAKAVSAVLSSSGKYMEKSGSDLPDGRISFYLRLNATSSKQYYIFIREGANDRIWTMLESGGNWQYRIGGSFYNISSYTLNEFQLYEIEWRSSDHTVRFRLAGGTWTGWVSPYGSWTNINKIHFESEDPATVYIDYIAENPYSPPAPITSGLLTFPWVLITVLAAFILCFIIDKGGTKIINAVKAMYRYRF